VAAYFARSRAADPIERPSSFVDRVYVQSSWPAVLGSLPPSTHCFAPGCPVPGCNGCNKLRLTYLEHFDSFHSVKKDDSRTNQIFFINSFVLVFES